MKQVVWGLRWVGLVALGLPGFAQSNHFSKELLPQLTHQLGQFYQRFATEKVYLHLDKPFYSAGDTIWLKAYLQADTPLPPDSLSRVLYVELIHAENYVLKRLILRVAEGTSKGDFVLADTLSTGTYRLRAYTQWMRNFGEEYFYNRSIQVISPYRREALSQNSPTTAPTPPTLQFFPEGGSLVYGLSSQVAFKALNPNGYGIMVAGSVYDSEGIELALLKTRRTGMGTFLLTPLKGRTYSAKVRFSDGNEYVFPLPVPLDNGFVLHLDPSPDDKIKLRVLSRPSPSDPRSGHFMVVGQSAGKVWFSATDTSGQMSMGTDIPKTAFPTGVISFTLFDGYGMPHCERLVFVNYQNELRLRIGRNKPRYTPGEKATLTLIVEDAAGNPVEGDFSVAVTDAGAGFSTDPSEETILTRLLLTSELKGSIEQPGYYFQNGPDAAQALDNLMLTQGWRRFKWQDLVSNSWPSITYPREKGLSLSGMAQSRTGKPLANTGLNLILYNQGKGILTATTDALGRFSLDGLDFKDNSLVIPTVNRKNGDQITLTLYGDTSPPLFHRNSQVREMLASNPEKDAQRENVFRLQKGVILLKEVKVKGRAPMAREAAEEARAKIYGKTYSHPDYTIDSVYRRDAFATNLLNALQGRVPGMQVIPSSNPLDPPRIVIRGVGTLSQSSSASAPLFLLDGIPVEASDVINLNSAQVDHIDVLVGASGAMYGARGANGVIAVYTRRGDNLQTANSKAKGPLARGFYEARTFYAPAHKAYPNTAETSRDARTTIYWNPEILTSKNGSALVSFFCATTATEYEVVIEGRSSRGELGRQVLTLKVE